MTDSRLDSLNGGEKQIVLLLLREPCLPSEEIWKHLSYKESTLTIDALRTRLTRMKTKGLVRQVVFNRWTVDFKPYIGDMFSGVRSVESLLVSIMNVVEWDRTNKHLKNGMSDLGIDTIIEKKHINSCFKLWISDLDDARRTLMKDVPQMVWEFLSLPYFGFRIRDRLYLNPTSVYQAIHLISFFESGGIATPARRKIEFCDFKFLQPKQDPFAVIASTFVENVLEILIKFARYADKKYGWNSDESHVIDILTKRISLAIDPLKEGKFDQLAKHLGITKVWICDDKD